MDNRAQIIIGADNQAGRGINQAKKDLRELGTAADRSGRQTKDSFRQATVSSNSFSGSIQQLHTRVVSLQGVLLGLGVGAGIYKSLDAFAVFDKGLIGIQKTTNMTDKQMQAMAASIRQLALEVPVATEGLLEIAEAAGQLGVTGVKDVTLFTETLAKMQIASDVVGAEGAKSLARLLNTAGEATEGVKILGSVIVALGNQMAASEAEIVHMASEIGRGTAAFNVSSASAAAYGAALKAMGARAEISGSAVTRSMIEIEKAIIAGGEKFLYLQEVTGMTGETIKRVFQEDSAKVFNAFILGAHDMTEEGMSAITILKDFGLTGTEVIKGLTPLIKNVEQLEKAFAIANKEVKNATALDEEAIRASKSFSAQMQLTGNVIDEIAAGIGKGLAPAIVEVTKDFRDWVEQNQEFINQELPDKIKGVGEQLEGVASSLSSIVDVYNSVPKDVVAVGGAGLIGRILFGTQAGLVLATLVALERADMGLSQIKQWNSELRKQDQERWDVLTGKRDWNTGAIKNIEDLTTAFVELHTAQGSVWVERGDMDAYLNSLNEIDGATSSLAGNTKGLGNSVEDVSEKVKAVNRELEEYYKELNKANTAMDRVTLAAMPGYERGLEQIERRYEGLRAALDEWGELADKTMPEIAQLHTDLGLSMDEEINDYIKSHETGTDTIYDTWLHMYERLQDITADWIYDMKVDFDSIVDLFKRTVAEMISAWIWGQQNMQFATSGQGGFSLGGMFGGMFGGGGVYGSGDPNNPNFVGPLQQGVQGAQSAYSLYGAYGAYQGAGGGWGGVKAGTSSFFGGGGGIASISWTTWAAIAYIAASMASKANVRSGYGLVEGDYTRGSYGEYQPGTSRRSSILGLDFFNEPISTYSRGLIGWDEPTASAYMSKALDESDWKNFFKSFPVFLTDPLGLFESALGSIGIDLGKIFGYSNKKRSYYGKSFEFGEYSPEAGWGDPLGEVYRDKRKGEKAFGESGEGMAQAGQDLMNMLDSMFKGLLGSFGENWENLFKTQMIDLAAQGLSFDFYISAEDKKEFESDWKKSWAKMVEGLIDPIVTIGTDLLSQALDGVVTDAVAWDYFSDEMREYLKTGLEDGLAGLKVDWSKVTDQESFEAALEQMGLAAQKIADIVEYFEQVGAILETITLAIDMHEFSSDANAAIAGFRAINAEFEQYALMLESMGVDLEKYTDLEVAHLIALQDEAKAMSDAAMSGEDLALAFDYLTEGMDRAEGATSGYWELLDSTISGILESIEDIKKRHEDYGKTDIDLLLEKHPEWAGMTYEQWEETSQNLENWSIEMLQDWRNLGVLLERQWEGQQATLETALEDIADTNAKALQSEREEIERLIQAFTRATEAITDYQDQLLGGAAGMLPPDIQYAQASQQLAGAMQDIYSEDRDMALAAIQDIPGYISQFLKASEAFSATPEQYMADFARAMTILNITRLISAKWMEDLMRALSNLAESNLPQNYNSYAFSQWGEGYAGGWVGEPPAGSYGDDWSMQSGGIVSGPKSGYTAPITFHGTEHVVPGDQMAGVKNELSDIKEVLVMIMNTNGDQNKFTKKTYDILEQWDEDDGSLVVTQAT